MTITERPVRPHIAVETFSNITSPFTLDYSRLDTAKLGDAASQPVWRDWTDNVITISSNRGGTQDGLTVKNQVGLLTVTLRDVAFDVMAPNFYAGQEIRLFYVNGAARYPLFTGQIRDLEKQAVRVNNKLTPVLQLVAVDAIAAHNAVTRYGAMPPSGAESFRSRISRLTSSATAPIEQPTGSYDGPQLGRTVYESTLSNHFTLACNTSRAMWWVGADGITRFKRREYDADNAVTIFGNYSYFEPTARTLHVVRDELRAGTRVMFNAVTERVLGAKPDDDRPSQWVADERDIPGSYLTASITTFGRQPVILTTNAADYEANSSTGWLLPYADLTGVTASLVLNAQEDLTQIPHIDIGASIWAPRRGLIVDDGPPWPRYLVIGVRHTITPTRWMVTLTLIGA